jgi:2-polyprenyl-6-methoxyphenol hydroxylase-like FAD-dependent oxidoreductase
MIRRLLFIFLFCWGAAARAQDSAPSAASPLTLEEAINIAQANNRQVRSAILTAAIDEDQVAEARTYRLSSMNVYALGSQLLTPVDFTFQKGAFGGIGRGKIFVVLERNDHWQAGLVFPKGQYQLLRAQGVEVVRKSLCEAEPRFARHAEALTDWGQLTLLSVESSRCPLWHKPGVLIIGEAAHVMSRVGGVGINYAVQDAVVAANVLAGPLKSGTVSEAHLAEV